ncbi:unnamed protein product [Eretmochelys imbricata]
MPRLQIQRARLDLGEASRSPSRAEKALHLGEGTGGHPHASPERSHALSAPNGILTLNLQWGFSATPGLKAAPTQSTFERLPLAAHLTRPTAKIASEPRMLLGPFWASSRKRFGPLLKAKARN